MGIPLVCADLAFHVILCMIDSGLYNGTFDAGRYMHPNGQLPAYEWTFSDVNPPVHAWAVWRIYKIEQKKCMGVR